jgi:hypothetical protein
LTKLAQSALLAAIISLTLASAAAQTLSGTAANGTTNKSADSSLGIKDRLIHSGAFPTARVK